VQYQIFDRIYRTRANDRHSALLLIGDPKQSIYGFRGADIHSYLQARRATAGRHYVLETNFRSTAPLVSVVNHWFAQADLARPAGAFMYRRGPDNPLPFFSVRRGPASEAADCAGHRARHDAGARSAAAHCSGHAPGVCRRTAPSRSSPGSMIPWPVSSRWMRVDRRRADLRAVTASRHRGAGAYW